MILGLNDDLERIRPAKGLTAWCESCNAELIPVCGDINIHHWRHKNLKDCDPWKENETDWHRDWKNRFPEDWLEVVIKKDSDIHRADIKTKAGLVVELQNSSISQSDILERELFYGNMVWLINAENFEQNFKLSSVVTRNLRSLDKKVKLQLDQNGKIDEELDSYFRYLNKQKEKLKNFQFDLKSQERKVDYLFKSLEAIEEHVTEFCLKLKKSSPLKYQTSQIFHDFNSDHLSSLQKISNRLDRIESDLSGITDRIKLINELPDYSIDSFSNFKIVPFKRVNPSSYTKCKVVKKETLNTFFPVIHDLNSESNFHWYSKQENAYTLLINLSNDLSSLLTEKDQLELERNNLINDKGLELTLLKKSMEQYIISQINESQDKISDLTDGVEYMEAEIQGTEDEIEEERKRLLEESIKNEERIQAEKEKKRFSIMKDKKGLYFYDWKYKRPSWNVAKAPLFFDFGIHIFQVINDEKLKKISRNEFIEFVKKWI